LSEARQAAVAGIFYPDQADELREMVCGFLAGATEQAAAPKAIIAPHAGYVYSGPIAASAYAQIASARWTIHRVVLLGPAHRVPFQGLAAPSVDRFVTPLGSIAIDHAGIERVLTLEQVQIFDQAHALEHSLEVHLPFLQEVLDRFTLVPLVVGGATPDEVAEVLELLWDGPETLIVISSDLSHYHDYATAQRLDRNTSNAIEALQPDAIHDDDACGRIAINGLLRVAKRRGLQATTLDLRNSGDTAGPRDRVVGYGAYVFNQVATTVQSLSLC